MRLMKIREQWYRDGRLRLLAAFLLNAVLLVVLLILWIILDAIRWSRYRRRYL